jgi:HAD superfamily phosphatase (TIGR01681 family)
MLKLVAFDGDDTLWTPLSGVNLSDRTPTDAEGYSGFAYSLEPGELPVAKRSDGALFALRPEAAEVMQALRERGVLVGVISYNHAENVRRILEAFGLLDYVRYVVAEWHTHKDRMLLKMLTQALVEGYHIEPFEALLVDDDPWEIYGKQCTRIGACFTRFGVEIKDLRDVLGMVGVKRET